jgi:predicted ATPase
LDRGCKVYQFHDSSNEGPLRQASPVNSANYLQAEGNNLASFLYLLKQNYPIEYKRIVSHVKMVVPQFRDFYLEPQNNYISLNWVDTSLNDYVFNSHQLSDGSIRFIALATLLLQPNKIMPNVIIIDEPELGLHPYAIDLLAEMIKDASLHTQIIIATQSSALIDNFDVDNITVIERDEDKGCTIANKLNSKELQEWLEEYSNSELWSKNVIGGRPI